LPRNGYIELTSPIGQRHVPHTEDVLERGDHVTFIGEKESVREAIANCYPE
jgi:Trk K+ transport system NAD-binding subunit